MTDAAFTYLADVDRVDIHLVLRLASARIPEKLGCRLLRTEPQEARSRPHRQGLRLAEASRWMNSAAAQLRAGRGRALTADRRPGSKYRTQPVRPENRDEEVP